MAAVDSTPLILFPGLAADANVFAPQKIAFPQLVVPEWPLPLPSESLDSYCDRLAEELRSHGDAVIGGASFGGIIALHVARRLRPRAVLLIGSLRSASEHPRVTRLCRPLKPLVPWIPVRFLQLCCVPLTSKLARRNFPHLGGLARQFHSADPTVFKWSIARILDWNSTPAVDCPVFRIHGDRDFVLPIRGMKPDTVVRGGGHVISLTHPSEVNEFIRSAIHQTAG
ncbi:MAG: alpha/beta hydrolase [Pirellulaceae bacterium]|jgi:pimeloyl-ACP methyl ester carboxylesterase|nr:alpha/beta hydrolase [Pirellulaceae bacterium]